MKILFVGHGRCGKDTALEICERITTLRSAGTFSRYLTPFVAREMGVSEAQAYRERHQNREEWMRIGTELRRNDPTVLARLAFANGDMSGGVRGRSEIEAIVRERLTDLIIWIDRDVPTDPTMEFGHSWADVRISNTGSVDSFEYTLRRLMGALGVLR